MEDMAREGEEGEGDRRGCREERRRNCWDQRPKEEPE